MKKFMPWEIVGEIDDPKAEKKLWLLKPMGSVEEGDEFMVAVGITDGEIFPETIEGDYDDFERLAAIYPQLVSKGEEARNLLWDWLVENKWWQKLSPLDGHTFMHGKNLSRMESLGALGGEAVERAFQLYAGGSGADDLEERDLDGCEWSASKNLDAAMNQAIKEFTKGKDK